MNNEKYETLESIFNNVNEWLKFAEAKNAILIALTGASLTAAIGYLCGENPPTNFYLKLYLFNFLLFSILGIALSLISFLPQTKLSWLWREGQKKENPNYFFFNDLACFSPDDLLKFLYKENNSSSLNVLRKNLACQIITNSKICRRKFHFFRVALWFILASIFTPLISISLYLLFDPNWHGTNSN
jgi:hypothetical protein